MFCAGCSATSIVMAICSASPVFASANIMDVDEESVLGPSMEVEL